jgi:hypothetical protein
VTSCPRSPVVAVADPPESRKSSPGGVLDDPVLRNAQPGVLADLAQPVGALAAAARGDDLRHQIELGAGDQPGGLLDDRRPGDLPGDDEYVWLVHAPSWTPRPLQNEMLCANALLSVAPVECSSEQRAKFGEGKLGVGRRPQAV